MPVDSVESQYMYDRLCLFIFIDLIDLSRTMGDLVIPIIDLSRTMGELVIPIIDLYCSFLIDLQIMYRLF